MCKVCKHLIAVIATLHCLHKINTLLCKERKVPEQAQENVRVYSNLGFPAVTGDIRSAYPGGKHQ